MNGAPTLLPMRSKERTPFGERLFQARKAARLTQPKLAALAGMGVRAFFRLRVSTVSPFVG